MTLNPTKKFAIGPFDCPHAFLRINSRRGYSFNFCEIGPIGAITQLTCPNPEQESNDVTACWHLRPRAMSATWSRSGVTRTSRKLSSSTPYALESRRE